MEYFIKSIFIGYEYNGMERELFDKSITYNELGIINQSKRWNCGYQNSKKLTKTWNKIRQNAACDSPRQPG